MHKNAAYLTTSLVGIRKTREARNLYNDRNLKNEICYNGLFLSIFRNQNILCSCTYHTFRFFWF